MKNFSLFILVLFSSKLFAGNDLTPVGARSSALGHASIALSDIWSTHHNQAGLAFLEKPSAGIYFENRFLISELNTGAGAFAIPTKKGSFGFSFQSFGYSLYNQSKVGVAYALKLSENFSVGVQLNYFQTIIGEGYGSAGAVGAEISAMYKLTEDLTIGTHIFNPSRSRFADFNDERIPTRIRVGLNYSFSKKLLVVAEVEKDLDFRPVLKGGFEYLANKVLFLRAGFNGNPTTVSFGAGLKFENFQFDLGTSYHYILGYSPQASLVYAF